MRQSPETCLPTKARKTVMNEQANKDLAIVNPNWSGFVLLVTLLSLFNQFLLLVIPENQDAIFVLESINLVIGLILWLDFFYLLRVSPNKRKFMTEQYGWMVLLGSLPALHFLRLVWFWLALRANNRSLRDFLSRIVVKQDGQGTLLLIVFIVMVVFEFAVVAILELEEAATGSTIHSVSDALWWAFATVTTVGYGDEYPVTNGGRFVAMILMILGVALVSVMTGWLAEWFLSRPRSQQYFAEDARELSEAQAIAEIKQLIEQHELVYQQTIEELKDRLTELERRF